MVTETSTTSNKEGIKKLFKWEGKKELLWIAFIALILISAWAYKRDTAMCKEVAKDPCYYCDAERQGETSRAPEAGFEGVQLEADFEGGNSKQQSIG